LGYHQIPLAKADHPTTTFITSFGQKNTGATYQRCMQFYFEGQIGRNLEVYVDDIVMKSWQSNTLITDLEETFNNVKCYNIELNPEKCTFGVPRGKLLGYIITEHGIKTNPKKSQPSVKWARSGTSRVSNDSLDALWPSVISCPD
jgi:hypothetical protein